MHSTYGIVMPFLAPYLQRRKETLFFRIGVPKDLRLLIGTREITRSLGNLSKRDALPIALECAAYIKRMFYELRSDIVPVDHDKLMKHLQQQKFEMRLGNQKLAYEEELDQQGIKHLQKIREMGLKSENQFLKLQLENQTLRRDLAGFPATPRLDPLPTPESPAVAPGGGFVPTLKTVVDGFLGRYKKDQKPAMYKKHQPVLNMFLEVVGDKPVDQIKQADINDFFDLICRLPPRWADKCRRQKLTVRELAELEFDITLGPKTFEDTYIASIRPFLRSAKVNWADQRFPLGLTTDGIEYTGDREEGESKQRAFKRPELQRLFEGKEMGLFAADEGKAHFYWLSHIGLFTGARVNEICQLNPQTDILQDEESSVWYFWITADSDADSRIRKSVKTGDSRKVPIHKKLIELGILKYLDRVKSQGHKLLFPEWLPVNRRASGEAEKWFRQFLRDTSLRDETPGATILGMHAFRHSLLTYGAIQKPPLSLFCISGHAQDETPIRATGAGRGYIDLSLTSPLGDKSELLNKLDYGLQFHNILNTKFYAT